MRISSAAAVFAASLSACTTAMGTNFSGIPEQKLAQYPADPPVRIPLTNVQTSPYDSPNFVVPPYLIQP